MVKELEELRSENQTLRTRLESRTLMKVGGSSEEEMQALRDILNEIEVVIPAEVSSTKEEKKRSLLQLFVNNKDVLIAGITNEIGADDVDAFYYYNVFPKLQVHGLSENEKVAGVRYRRSYVNKYGQSFLAWGERRQIAKKKTDQKK
jgi:hypothetical protein